jgi:maleamate amidohydrolase
LLDAANESLNLVKTQHEFWNRCIQEVGILPFGGHMSDSFENAGYGQGEVGWGTRPAIIAVDFQMSFCDPKFALGRSEHAQRAIKNAARLFPAARAAGIPIIHTAVAWSTDTEFARWKVPALRDIHPGSYEAQIHPDLWDDNDVYILKRFPSAFFGTDMSSILTTNGIDTVLVTGVTSSGCVRATIVDSFSYGFRTIAIDDACGDQDAGPHDANMQDVGRRYADVIQTDEAISKIKALG